MNGEKHSSSSLPPTIFPFDSVIDFVFGLGFLSSKGLQFGSKVSHLI
jgi:hypothetical protein